MIYKCSQAVVYYLQSPAGGKYEHYHDWLNKLEAERKAGGNGNVPAPKFKAPAGNSLFRIVCQYILLCQSKRVLVLFSYI